MTEGGRSTDLNIGDKLGFPVLVPGFGLYLENEATDPITSRAFHIIDITCSAGS